MRLIIILSLFFFFNDTATTEIYTLSLHDALPILVGPRRAAGAGTLVGFMGCMDLSAAAGRRQSFGRMADRRRGVRSEEHTSELQSRQYLVCRLLLEKKKKEYYIQLVKNKIQKLIF